MTRKEAIGLLSGLMFKGKLKEALDLAIKALEQEPTTKNDIRVCKSCVYSKDGKCAGTEECHLCMWKNQYTPTTKNNLGVDKEQLKTMIRGLTKWYVKRDNTEVGEPDTAVGLLYDDVMFGINRLTPVTPQEPRKGHWISIDEEPHEDWECDNCSFVIWADENIEKFHYCPNCGAKMVEPQESEDHK